MNDPTNTQAPRSVTEAARRPAIRRSSAPPPLPGARRSSGPPPLPPAARAKRPVAPHAVIAAIPPSEPTELTDADLEDTRPLVRVPLEQLERVQVLLESIGDIRSASSAEEVMSRCAAAVTKALDARGVVIHHHDQARGEVRVVAASGPSTEALLGSVADTEDDFVASAVLSNGGTMTVRVDGQLPRFLPQRLRGFGASRSIMATPIMSFGRCVAIVELVDVEARCEKIVSNVCGMVREPIVRALLPLVPAY